MSRLIVMNEYRKYLPLKGLLKAETWSTHYSGRTEGLYAALRSVAMDLLRASRSLLGQSSVSLMLSVLDRWLIQV